MRSPAAGQRWTPPVLRMPSNGTLTFCSTATHDRCSVLATSSYCPIRARRRVRAPLFAWLCRPAFQWRSRPCRCSMRPKLQVFRFRGMSSADLADGIAFLLQRSEQRAAIQEQMRLWVDRRRWPLIAKRFHGMLKGLSLNWTHLDPAPPHADGVMPPMVHRSAPFLASV